MPDRLLEALDRLIAFLELHENPAWPAVLRSLRSQAESVDPSDQTSWRDYYNQFGRLFGGMGSLDDLTICQVNGHRVDDEIEANSLLQELVSTLRLEYQSARWRTR